MVTSVTSHLSMAAPSSWEEKMVQLLKADSHWRERVSAVDKERLKDHPPYQDYILTKGSSISNFVLYYLKEDQSIQTSEFSLDLSAKSWHFKNAIDYKSTDISKVIAYILQPH